MTPLSWRKTAPATPPTFEQRDALAIARAEAAVAAFTTAASELEVVAQTQRALVSEAVAQAAALRRQADERESVADDLEVRAYETEQQAEKIRALVG